MEGDVILVTMKQMGLAFHGRHAEVMRWLYANRVFQRFQPIDPWTMNYHDAMIIGCARPTPMLILLESRGVQLFVCERVQGCLDPVVCVQLGNDGSRFVQYYSRLRKLGGPVAETLMWFMRSGRHALRGMMRSVGMPHEEEWLDRCSRAAAHVVEDSALLREEVGKQQARLEEARGFAAMVASVTALMDC